MPQAAAQCAVLLVASIADEGARLSRKPYSNSGGACINTLLWVDWFSDSVLDSLENLWSLAKSDRSN